MKRVLYAWELGANLGHIAAFLPVAECLRDQGCEIVCAVRETNTAARVLSGKRIPWLQAPYLIEAPLRSAPLNYTDIMLRFGFQDEAQLLGHIGAWLSIFQMTGAQVVVADHAPAALLAAHFAKLPTVLFGTGFCCPPPSAPLPSMRPWEQAPNDALRAGEAQALATINRVAAQLRMAELSRVGELFSVAETAILGFPELDHYPQRQSGQDNVRYWGVIGNSGIGATPQWPDMPGRRLFAYVRPGHPSLAALFQAIVDLQLPTVLYCPGLDDNQRRALQGHRHIAFSIEPLDLKLAFAQADAAITHGNFATSAGFLQAGKPLLVLPTHLEQFLFACRVEQNGFGLQSPADHAPNDLVTRLYRVATDPFFRTNTEAFSRRYQSFDQVSVVRNVAQKIIQLTEQDR